MVALANVRAVLAAIAVAVLFCTLPATGADLTTNGVSQAPPAVPKFSPGDVVQIGVPSAKLMLGSDVLAEVGKGEPIVVVETRDSWVGTVVSIGGRSKAGWIRTDAFIPGSKSEKQDGGREARLAARTTLVSAGQVYSTYRPVLPDNPAPAPLAESREVRDEYVMRRNDLHETDPNMHTWEPWRHR